MAPTLRSMVVFNLVSGWLARLLHVERQSRAQISRPLVYESVELERLRHGRVQTKTKARRRQ